MQTRIYFREIQGSDTAWHEVTPQILKGDVKIRSGFSSLGNGADLGKLSLTYQAADLATATIFSSTVKAIRVTSGTTVVWEGYTDGSSSVESTGTSDLAWVKLNAYPYIKRLENVVLDADVLEYNLPISRPLAEGNSVVGIIWQRMTNLADAWVRDAIGASYTIDLPSIPTVIPLVVLKKDDVLMDKLVEVLKEYCFCIYTDASHIHFVQPYTEEGRAPTVLPWTHLETKPSIKSSPYVSKISPNVTMSKIVEKKDVQVYTLSDDGSNAEQEIYRDGTTVYSPYYPEEGPLEVRYSNPRIEKDTVSLEWAKDFSITYQARYSDNSADAVLEITQQDLGGLEGLLRLKNTSTEKSCYLNQLFIHAGTAYFRDSSTILRSNIAGADESDVETKWILQEDDARLYARALASESRSETSTITFRTNTLPESVRVNSLVKVGDAVPEYLVKTITRDLDTGTYEISCVMYSLADISPAVLYRAPKPWTIAGKNASARKYLWRLSKSSTYERFVEETSLFKGNGSFFKFNGMYVADNSTVWKTERPIPDATYPYLWEKYSDDDGKTWSEPSMVQSYYVHTIRLSLSRPTFDIGARGVTTSDQTIVVYVVNSDVAPESLSWSVTSPAEVSIESERGVKKNVITIPRGYKGGSVTVTCFGGGASASVTIGVNTVGDDSPRKFALVDRTAGESFPSSTPEGEPLVVGDYCLAKVLPYGESDLSKAYLEPYRYNGTEWTTIDVSDHNYAEVMSGVGPDVIASDISVPETSAVYAFFKHMFAMNAVIDNLFAQMITLKNGGVMKSNNVSIDEKGDNHLSKAGFILDGDAGRLQAMSAWFKKVNIVDGNFSGDLNAASGTFTGELVGATGTFSGGIMANSGVFKGTFDTPSIKSVQNEQQETLQSHNFDNGTDMGTAPEISQYAALGSWIDSLGIKTTTIFKCSLSIDSAVNYVSIDPGENKKAGRELKLLFYSSNTSYVKEVVSVQRVNTHGELSLERRSYFSGKGVMTITIHVGGGEKLYFDVQVGSGGIETDVNRVYRDENGFLKIITE